MCSRVKLSIAKSFQLHCLYLQDLLFTVMARAVIVSAEHSSGAQLAEDCQDDGASYITILLLGPSGVGKSTTGNKLLRVDEGTKLDRWNSLQFGLLQPEKENEAAIPKLIEPTASNFAVGEGTECKTRRLELLSSIACGIRVLDAPGFGDMDPNSDKIEGISDLQLIRKILAVQEELDLHFHLVLFFLPKDCTRANLHLTEQLQHLYNMFGVDIFKIMLAVATVNPLSVLPPENVRIYIEQCRQAFSTAMQRALKGDYATIERKPEVVFITSKASNEEVKSLTLDKRPLPDRHIKLQFNPSLCYKCGQQLRKLQNAKGCQRNRGDTGDYQDLPEIHQKFRNAKPSHEYKVLEPSSQFNSNPEDDLLTDTCHVAFIPRDSKLKRVAGRAFHVVSLGMYYLYQKAIGRERVNWWDFEEVCIKCQQGPGSTPCFIVGQKYDLPLSDGTTEAILVQHRSYGERLVHYPGYSELKL